MDFGGLDNILDDDIGYIPTAIKRDLKPRERPASISRQNSSKSIGSVRDQKDQKETDSLFGLTRQSPNDQLMKNSQQLTPNSGKRNTLFGLHKQTSQQVSYLNQPPMSFQDVLRIQNNPTQNIQPLSKPPLPQPKNTSQRRLEKNSSFTQLNSPENILEDDLNNSSVASRRGRPPLSRRSQNIMSEMEVVNNNKSENLMGVNTFFSMNDTSPVLKNPSMSINTINTDKVQQQSTPNNQLNQPFNPPQSLNTTQQFLNTTQIPAQVPTISVIPDKSIQQLKHLFSTQLDYQKEMFQALIKQQRQSHQSQIKKLKQFHLQETKKKLQLKDFEIQKMKQFYELRFKIQSQRQSEVKQYSSIAKKLQGNIEIIQKLQRNINQNHSKDRLQKNERKLNDLNKKETQLKEKQAELKSLQNRLEQDAASLKQQKLQIVQQLNTQKNRIYQLQVSLRSKQSQLQIKHKKLQAKLIQEYEYKSRVIQKQKQQLRMQSLQLKQQKNMIQLEKLQVINSRKLWDNEKRAHLQQLHQQKTKVMQKEIEIASRTGSLEIKQQEMMMNQNDYANRLKLIELEKRRLEVEKRAQKGQLCFNNNGGLIGTTVLLNKTLQSQSSALNKQFYSNDNYQNQRFQPQSTTNYKKSITQMRDEFLKSLPKF